jgi:small subunit ribosomal protein S20
MPVTKTAKRALRSSKRKSEVNKVLLSKLEIALRVAEKSKKPADINKAVSYTDRAKKKNMIHKNKAARLKSRLGRLSSAKKETAKKASAPKKKSSKK